MTDAEAKTALNGFFTADRMANLILNFCTSGGLPTAEEWERMKKLMVRNAKEWGEERIQVLNAVRAMGG